MQTTLLISLFIVVIVFVTDRVETAARQGMETYVEASARNAPDLYEGGAYAEPLALQTVAYLAPAD